MSDELVDLYDFPSKQMRKVRIQDLPSHFIRVKIDGIENVCWADPHQLTPGPHRHPPFDSQRRALLQRLTDDLGEVYPMTLQEWEDGFRRDRNPDSEIRLWLNVADAYRSATASPRTPEAKKEIFSILIGCINSDARHILASKKLTALSRSEAQALILSFTGRSATRD
jgi:hypothetical protein